MAVELVGRSDHRRIGSVLLLPGVETHHRGRRRAFLVVGIGEQAAAPGRNAERGEEIAGDVLADSPSRLEPANRRAARPTRRCRTDLERRQVLECRSVGAKEPVRLPREETPVVLAVSVCVAAADAVADAPKLFGPCDRQRPQHDLLQQRENRRGRPDAQRKRDHRGGGEARRSSQAPH